ncbi:MAG: site-specific DNA-methyltransferase [Chloroflexi bacterium]|nr:site-specific DNA-methyltransferase [Chloroflexota bacterium]
MTDKPWRIANEKGYLSSLWTMERDDDRKLEFHGGFIPAVVEGLLLRHTDPGDRVWDCFAGSGTTKLVADRLGRKSFLTDLNPTNEHILCSDARSAHIFSASDPTLVENPSYPLDRWPLWHFNLVIAHPPYHSIIRFSDNPADLSNCPNVGEFLIQFDAVCQNINRHLRPGGYLGLVIGDIWVTREQAKATGDPYGYFPLGFECMKVAMECIEDAVLTATVVKKIEGNRHNAHRANLMKARLFKAGATTFNHEYVFSIKKGGA